MPRSKEGKKRIPVNKDGLFRAVQEVTKGGSSIRQAAKCNGVDFETLRRHLRKFREQGSENFVYHNNCDHKLVFSKTEEDDLVKYLVFSSKLLYGLTRTAVASLAFDFAKRNHKKYPPQWEENGKAGKEWVVGFMKRHEKEISLRSPQPTSIGRAICFNKPVVDSFFNNLANLYGKYSFSPVDIYNVDESGLSTVQKPPKIIAQKGARSVGSVSSAERGTNVTLISTINALGNSIPPILVFPRVRYQEHMILGAPPGTKGVANASGWSTSAIFTCFIEHFIEHVRPTPEKPVLLLMDNHESHLCVEAIDLAKQNGVIMFTFPPHTTHRLQPLDRGVFGPLKTFYNQQCEMWMNMHNNGNENTGKPITIYNVASFLGKAYPRAFTPVNIQSGFRASGIYPLDPGVFTEEDFLPSQPSNRPVANESHFQNAEARGGPIVTNQSQSPAQEQSSLFVVNDSLQIDEAPSLDDAFHVPPTPRTSQALGCGNAAQIPATPGTSKQSTEPGDTVPSSRYISPSEIRPLPRVQSDPQKKARRRLGRSRILTDTPEKVELEKAAKAKQTIKDKKFKRQLFDQKKKKPPVSRKRPAPVETSCSEEDSSAPLCDSQSDVDFETVANEIVSSNDDGAMDDTWDNENEENNIGKWILVRFICPNATKFYVGVVQNIYGIGQATVKFARKKPDFFVWPEVEDVYQVRVADIHKTLPNPVVCRRGQIKFPVSFAGINVF